MRRTCRCYEERGKDEGLVRGCRAKGLWAGVGRGTVTKDEDNNSEILTRMQHTNATFPALTSYLNPLSVPGIKSTFNCV